MKKSGICGPRPGAHHALAYRVTNHDPQGRYRIIKDVITGPHLPCILQHTKIDGEEHFVSRLRLYALCAPHLQVGGKGNNAYVIESAGREILAAEKDGLWIALAASIPFSRLSCGYVGASDGWTDLARNFRMDWEFDQATDGNIALFGELIPDERREFTLALAFGDGLHNAVSTLFQALGFSFEEHHNRYVGQWDRICKKMYPVREVYGDGGNLYHSSYSLLLAHEDKKYPGAFIASLSIPWGESKGDDDMGGYHLVWTRDMVNTAMALLACGNKETPLRALIYLAATQHDDGGFSQNFWINGESYWRGIQLDEVAFPILLAWRLREIWKHNRKPRTVQRGYILRIQASASFRLRWTRDEWRTTELTRSTPTALGIEFADIPVPDSQQAPIRFTFHWLEADLWEGQDYEVAVVD